MNIRDGDPDDFDPTLIRRPPPLPVLVIVIVVCLMATLLGGIVILLRQDNLISDIQTQNVAGCERGNAQRIAQVDQILDSAAGNQQRAAAWETLFDDPLPPSILTFAHVQRQANLSEVGTLTHDANKIANAQHAVAVHPDAPDPRERAVVDCREVYG